MRSSQVARIVETIVQRQADSRLRALSNMQVGHSSLVLEDKETGDHFVVTVIKKKEPVWPR